MKRSKHSLWAVWMSLLFGLGCGSESEFWLWPELPEDTQSILVGVEDGLVVVLRALRYPRDSATELGPTSGAVTIFAYPESLEARGLTEGAVARGAPADCWSRPLAPGATMFERALGEDAWSQRSAVRAPYDTFLALSDCPCPRFEETETHSFAFPGGSRARLARLQDELYWLSNPGSVRWVDIEAPLSEGTPIEPNFFHLSPEDTFVDETGVAWATLAEVVYMVDLETGQVRTSTQMAQRASGIHGAYVEGSLQLFMAADGGRVFRFHRGVWSEIRYDATGVFPDSEQNGGALWIGPGRGLIAVQDARALLAIAPEVEPRVIDREGLLAVSAMALATDGLVYLGSRSGEFATVDGTELRRVRQFGNSAFGSGVVRRLFPLGDRLGFAVRTAALGEVVPGAGVCPAHLAEGFQEVFDAVGDETQTILVGQDSEGKLRVARYARSFD